MGVNYIKPTEVKAQMKMSNLALQNENKVYSEIQTQATKLGKDKNLNGKSWTALKRVYRNYAATARLMIQANNATIKANNLFATRVGSEELIRPQIMEKIKQLEETIRRKEDFLERTSGWHHMTSSLRAMRSQARQTISYCRRTIAVLKGKLRKMDEIERNTRNVYKDASKIYTQAEKQMKKVKDAWNGKINAALIVKSPFDTTVSSIKMEDMERDVSDQIYEVDREYDEDLAIDYDMSMLEPDVEDIVRDWQVTTEDGVIDYDITKIDSVLERDQDEITDPEYDALAYLLISVDKELVLDNVLGLCQVINHEFDDLNQLLQEGSTQKAGIIFKHVEAYETGDATHERMVMRDANKVRIDDVLSGKVTLENPKTKTDHVRVQFVRE